jgi:hypothetical protein
MKALFVFPGRGVFSLKPQVGNLTPTKGLNPVEQSSEQVTRQAFEVADEQTGDSVSEMSEGPRVPMHLRQGRQPLADRVKCSSGVSGAASGRDGPPNPR